MQPELISETIRRFEQAWTRGESPRLSDYLATSDSASSADRDRAEWLSALIPIDLRWRSRNGQPVDPTDYRQFGPIGVNIAARAIERQRDLETEYVEGDAPTATSERAQDSARDHVKSTKKSAKEASESTKPGEALTEGAPLTERPETASETPHPASNTGVESPSLRPPAAGGQTIDWMTEGSDTEATHGRYRIVHELGQGGLGIVWKCDDTELHRTVALKEIRGDRADDRLAQEAFRAEAEITGLLEHPGVVPIYSLGNGADGRPYYAMQLISRVEMRDRVLAFHRDVQAGDEVFLGPGLRGLIARLIDVCNVIRYAHSRGVYHRDLKTSNVMIGKYGETFVIDWGLAKTTGKNEQGAIDSGGDVEVPVSTGYQTGPLARQGAPIGTVAYAPPEQLLGEHDKVDARSDIFCLGAILYEVLTSRPPCAGKSLSEAVRAIENRLIPSPKEKNGSVPSPLSAIAMKALSASQDDRYASVRELRNDLQRWLDDEPVVAYHESIIERLSRWKRRHETFVRVATAALILLTIVSAAAAFLIDRSRKEEMRAREQATELYGIARSATDNFLMKASERLKEAPGMTQVRRKLLADAADAYRTMLRVQSNREDLRRESALAGIELAKVQKELEAYDEAIQSLEESREILKQSGSLDDRLLIAQTYIEESRIHGLKSPRDTGAATDAINQAQERLQSPPLAESTQPAVRQARADALMQQGIVAHDLGDPRAMEKFNATSDELFASAVDQFNQLFNSSEDTAELRDYRISASRALVNSLHNDSDDARYIAALDAADRFLAGDPRNPELLEQKGLLLNNYGDFLLDQDDPQQAKDVFRRAESLFAKLSKDYDSVLDYRDSWLMCLDNLGRALRDSQDGLADNAGELDAARYKAITEVLEKAVRVADYKLEQTTVSPSFADRAATAKSRLGTHLVSTEPTRGEQFIREAVKLANEYFVKENLRDEEVFAMYYRLEYPLVIRILEKVQQLPEQDDLEKLALLVDQSSDLRSPALRLHIASEIAKRAKKLDDQTAQQQYIDFAANHVRESLAFDPGLLAPYAEDDAMNFLRARRPAAFAISNSNESSTDVDALAPATGGTDDDDPAGASGT